MPQFFAGMARSHNPTQMAANIRCTFRPCEAKARSEALEVD